MLHLPDGSTATFVGDPSGVRTVIVKRPPPESFDGDLTPQTGPAPFDCYVPHTRRHPKVVAAAPTNAQWVDVAQSPNAYYAALTAWWAQGATFMVIEHDVVCSPEIIAAFDACPEPWCLHQYDPVCPCGNPACREAWRNALGCTRFRADLIAAVPDALTSIPPDNWDWHNVCDGLGNNLRAAGYTHHWHEPPVPHIRREGTWEA